ncbi:50S ribosomal protein L10 [Guggenheimella bovis]
MSKNRELKEAKVQEISEKIAKAVSAVVVDYRGLTVEEVTELRNQFRNSNVEYRVYKNRLVKLAVKDTPFEALSEVLVGPNGIAISYDEATAPAKIAKEFAKKNDKLEIRAGVIDGEYYDLKGVLAIADIPSREVLLSKLLGSMQSPLSSLARAIQAVADKNAE